MTKYEQEEQHLENDPGDWYLKTAKLAVAVALIKTRPVGRTGRQQAEYLASRLLAEDNTWKAKAQNLEKEVLWLQQELLLSKVQVDLGSSGPGAGNLTLDQPPNNCEYSMKNTLTLERDSGLGTGSNMEELPPSQGPCLSQPILSAGILPLIPTATSDNCERALLLHTQFLQNLAGFQWLATSDRNSSVVIDSVCQLISCLMAILKDPGTLPPTPLLRRAAQVTAQTVDSFCGPAFGKLVERVEDCLKELTGLLLKLSQLDQFQVQKTLADCLILLGGSSSLKPSFVHHALCEINRFGDHLRQNESEALERFDVAQYENMMYLFWILEQLLREESVPDCSAQRRLPESRPSLSAELSRLEANVLLLSDEFPLFAIYAWRIGVCLKSTAS
ncbi:meiosis-specific protein MEI4 [Scleropages formosus]|nr:meiosis-specific protein MEI4 [Scleropages formosus]